MTPKEFDYQQHLKHINSLESRISELEDLLSAAEVERDNLLLEKQKNERGYKNGR